MKNFFDVLNQYISENQPSSVREVQALGAVYTLIDYLANRIAEIGETPEGEEE